ncbi:DUF6477 family protein [Methylocystis sp. SC2]|uniref:DUF6477 family protein n=1 Tax=Methylocystis sp. (strain SC2) TaxID=187303 RepID=UPI00027AE8B1|nr:DUF6477 family protein [Methylocystis sp. SC2]CCJ08541.1 uncharacterized protein BN69_3090 [Methylocystis sp. SC2]
MTHRPVLAPQDRPARFAAEAGAALQAALAAGLNAYDRTHALARFHRLSPDTIASESPDAARAALKEIERAMRGERARRGHWSYDLNRHISLLVAHRAETARLHRLLNRA